MKKIISTDNAPSAIGTYSQAVLINNFLYVSGQIALDPKNMKMVEGIDNQIEMVFKNIKEKVIIYGNLPFNISTKLLTIWISDNEWPSFFDKMILMFQKEVADRIISNFNNKTYGRLSIIANWRLNIKKICDIDPHCFSPKPKVDSSLLFFKPKKIFYQFKNSKNLEKIRKDETDLLIAIAAHYKGVRLIDNLLFKN